MPRQIPIPKIVDAIITGIVRAQKEYTGWTGDEWLAWAPEYLITSYVAKEIASINGPGYITLEGEIRETLTASGALSKGRLSKYTRPDGKCDILLWWGGGTPRGMIEIKNDVSSYSRIRNDIIRLRDVILKNANQSSLQFGALGFFTEEKNGKRFSGKDRILRRFSGLLEKVENDVKVTSLWTLLIQK